MRRVRLSGLFGSVPCVPGRTLSERYAGSLGLIGVVMLVLMACVYVGEKRWAAMGLDLDGKETLPDWTPEAAAGEAGQ